MRKTIFISFLLFFSTLPFCSLAQWQADMINSVQGSIQNYQVHSDGSKYRYDYNPGDMNGVVIVDPETNVTAIILVDEQMVHYTPSDGMMSRMNDPAQAYGSYLNYGTEKNEGEEMVNGYRCTKKVVIKDGEPFVTQWFSEKLNFPVKMVVHSAEGTYMELQNIRSWEPNPSVFVVPEGYIEVDEKMRPIIPEPEPPSEWEIVDASAPVEMAVSRGMMIVVPINESVYHKLIVENTGDTPCKFSYNSFRDGEELPADIQGPEKFRTRRLHMGEDYKMTLDWKAGQLVKIHVFEGKATLQLFKE